MGHSNIREQGTLSVTCAHPFDGVAAWLEGSIAAHELAILQVYDFERLIGPVMLAPGVRCRVYEVLHARLATKLLAFDLRLAHLLPSRILMHDEGGVTTVVAPLASALMPEYSHEKSVARLARSFDILMLRVLLSLQSAPAAGPASTGGPHAGHAR